MYRTLWNTYLIKKINSLGILQEEESVVKTLTSIILFTRKQFSHRGKLIEANLMWPKTHNNNKIISYLREKFKETYCDKILMQFMLHTDLFVSRWAKIKTRSRYFEDTYTTISINNTIPRNDGRHFWTASRLTGSRLEHKA